MASTEAEAVLARDTDPSWQFVVAKLQAIVSGERAVSLAEDAGLTYMDVVELTLLLQSLG